MFAGKNLSALALLPLVFSWFAPAQTFTISTLAGGGLPVNVKGTSANLYATAVPAVDQAGNVYFTQEFSILRLDAVTGIVTLFAGNGTPGFSGDNGLAVNAQITTPGGLAVDSAGNVFIADTGNGRIRKVSNGVITSVAGGGPINFFAPESLPASNVYLGGPEGLRWIPLAVFISQTSARAAFINFRRG